MPSTPDRRAHPVDGATEWKIIEPISTAEVARHLRSLKDGAAGPDHRVRHDVRKLSAVSLDCRFNMWLITGISPEAFRHGVTVLNPKTPEDAERPHYRPIAMVQSCVGCFIESWQSGLNGTIESVVRRLSGRMMVLVRILTFFGMSLQIGRPGASPPTSPSWTCLRRSTPCRTNQYSWPRHRPEFQTRS